MQTSDQINLVDKHRNVCASKTFLTFANKKKLSAFQPAEYYYFFSILIYESQMQIETSVLKNTNWEEKKALPDWGMHQIYQSHTSAWF